MNRRSVVVWLAGAFSVALLTACAAGNGGASEGREASITIRYSAFEPAVLTVPSGVPVTIALHNDDPIEHEWIVGPDDVHEAHRTGTEPVHNVRPTEVTLPPFTTRETTITFDRAGTYAFICHLPGHEAYGMAGTLVVVDD